MFFLNFTAGEFFALLGALGSFITVLYLLDRTKRRKVVSTLRFWTGGAAPEQQQSRRRMHEPWSLALQLLSLLLLLLALGQLQWGSRARRGRDDVLLLDTSAWSGERTGGGTLLDTEKRKAAQYIDSLPSNDRVLVVRADSLTTPVTPFTSDRARLLEAIAESTPGYTSFNAQQAIAYARQAQMSSGGQPGEIVYVGPKLISDQDSGPTEANNLRIISTAANLENCGIVSLSVKRANEAASAWQAFVRIKNYGTEPRTIQVRTQFAGTRFNPRMVVILPAETKAIEYNFLTNVAGQLTADLAPADALRSDDSAALYLPRDAALRVAVYTSRPELLKPLLSLNPRLAAKIYSLGEYVANPPADVAILDRFSPAVRPKIPSLWIQPPTGQSPVPVKATITEPFVSTWNPQGDLTTGLRARELPVADTEVFETFEGDTPVASAPEGPIIVARPPGRDLPQLAVMGFDPFAGELRFRVTTPLLLANLLRWLRPEAFQHWEISARQVGPATIALDPEEETGTIHVSDERGLGVPFTIRNHVLQLFVGHPSVIRISSAHYERVLSLTLPDVAAYNWRTSGTVAEGVPLTSLHPSSVDLWKWLAASALLILLLEWILFGPRHTRPIRTTAPAGMKAERERELVSK